MVTTHEHAYLYSLLPLRRQEVQLLLTDFTTSALQIGRHPLSNDFYFILIVFYSRMAVVNRYCTLDRSSGQHE